MSPGELFTSIPNKTIRKHAGSLNHCTSKHWWVMELQRRAQALLWFRSNRLNLPCHRTETSSNFHKKDYYLPAVWVTMTLFSIYCSHKLFLGRYLFSCARNEHLFYNLVRFYIQMHKSRLADEKTSACVSQCWWSGSVNGCSPPTCTQKTLTLSDSSGVAVFPAVHI